MIKYLAPLSEGDLPLNEPKERHYSQFAKRPQNIQVNVQFNIVNSNMYEVVHNKKQDSSHPSKIELSSFSN